MEIDSDNVAEIEKYAFLLGSAIKNEDTEQFFSIYDSILPKDLPDKQLEEIKDKARRIAELPEGRFNDLVFRARTFSLAPSGPTMSSPSKKWSPLVQDEESEDEGVGSTGRYLKNHSSKSDTCSLYSQNTTKVSTRSSESDTRRFDDDSGVCNSSKATNSISSLSDHEGSDYENRGHFDYFPPQVKIRSGCGLNLDYDEVHEVKSDHSSQDVNSPRSDFSDGIEMVTMTPSHRNVADNKDDDDDFSFNRKALNDQDDFNTEEDSDEDQNSYHNKYYKQGYRPIAKENDYKLKFDSNSKQEWGYMSNSSLRSTSDVDKRINFSSLKEGQSPYSRYSSYSNCGSSASSEKVKIEKNSYKKDPPFGKGHEQLHKVAHSVDTLISSSIPAHEVKNMPEGRKLEVLTSEDPKKKKKKKRNTKDDAGTTDENGNPIEGLNSACYRQMREPPSTVAGPAGNNRQHYDSYGTFHGNDQFANHRDSIEDGSNKAEQKPKRKKTKNKEDVKLAEQIENYVGNKSVDELIDFIGGQHESNKKTKKLSSPITDDIPGKAQKANKKIKDKKHKSPTSSNSIEEVDSRGDYSAQTASLDKQGGLNNMGNSSGKTDADIVENGDTDGIYTKKDKVTKALLKENDKKLETSVINHISVNKTVNCKELKEKESTKTVNKKETGSDTSVENKKKTEKTVKPALKAEKSEMSTSKVEDMIKMESSVTNAATIKQKNAKNKKSKPTSPTVKLEHELPTPELQINHHSFIADDSLIINNNFIFTDLDVRNVPKEDEFQVVGKKKKKVTTKEMVQHNNYLSNNGNHKPNRRYDDKRPANSYPNNKLPAPSAIQTFPMDNDTHARDLSPSAFPALGSSKGRQSLHDGRRNSTGDVPIPSETLKLHDDSDMESVKSLPAIQGGCVVDTMLSPRLISYAKMAASAKQEGSLSPGDDDQCSFDGEDNEGHDHKKAVWKGSPTERRHSIGSSPEEVNIGSKAASSPKNSAATSLKAGSQENIKGVSVKLDSNVGVKTNTDWGMGKGGEVVNIKEDINVLGKAGISNESSRNAKVCVAATPVQTVNASLSVSSHTKYQDIAQACNTTQLLAEKPVKIASAEIELKVNSNSSVNGKISSSNKTNYSLSSVHKQEIQKPKSITTNNNKKQKSVIFLDKRVEETPENLGISFGFEIEPLVNNVSKPEVAYINTNIDKSETSSEVISFGNIDANEVSSTAPVHSAGDSSVSFLSEPAGSIKDADIIPSNKSSNPSVIPNISNPKSEPTSSSNRPLAKKIVSELGRLNGVVSPAQGKTNMNLSKEVSEDKQGEIKSPTSTPATLGAPFVGPLTQVNNEVIVYYGESVATLKKDVIAPSPTNGPTRYCGLLGFIQESELKSNFNLAEAAAFLTREWDRTLQMQDREPGRVQVHVD